MASNSPNLQDRVEFKRRKRTRIDSASTSTSNPPQSPSIKWRSPAEQIAYSSKLFEALRHVRRRISPPSPSSSSASTRSRAVRDAADKALAIAARGRSRWSRSILANRLKRQIKNHKKASSPTSKQLKATPSSASSFRRPTRLPPLQRRVKILGGLVPGCRKLSFPNLLEEATDYIAALEMQIRAMSAIADLLSGASSSSAANPDRPDLT